MSLQATAQLTSDSVARRIRLVAELSPGGDGGTAAGRSKIRPGHVAGRSAPACGLAVGPPTSFGRLFPKDAATLVPVRAINASSSPWLQRTELMDGQPVGDRVRWGRL